jgi:TPR repeat protein
MSYHCMIALLVCSACACAADQNAAKLTKNTTADRRQQNGSEDRSFNFAQKDLVKACRDGDETSCASLVDLYQLSLSAPHMVEFEFSLEAIRLISKWWVNKREENAKACRDGDGAACFDAFGMWLVSEFHSYDESKALEFMIRGCELGHAESCSFLGAAWRDGYPSVTNRDEEKSREAYRRACDLGDTESCSK